MSVSPVTFPPGRAKLATGPEATGSPTVGKMMGMVLLAFFAARIVCVPPEATMTSTLQENQLGGEVGQPSRVSLSEPVLNGDVPRLHVAGA